ncbi:hypothetical protein P40081_22270 [Paenibacillus sp. FSL P4-0081]|uniref:AMP-binding protein n=1 Tax=Paenibacillus sp. FSL P4-0081 TaxID=1536769 RepID=UPI0004F8E34A|nr:AMP-binding protein [Paenibacillus sp. FSL P4-0081]AIQ30586.1 hypothetical protein P40081_22270 [Paenibacillus sp. FSL P4-0081]
MNTIQAFCLKEFFYQHRLFGTHLIAIPAHLQADYIIFAGHFISSAGDASAVGLPPAGTEAAYCSRRWRFTVISPSGSLAQKSCGLLRTHEIAAGELLIASAYVADGYFNAADSSEEVFITSPTFGTIYRTGDMAEMDDTGRIMFKGRRDAQIKIRGYRIEPNRERSNRIF